MTATMAVSRWTAPAICSASGGRGACGATSGRRCCRWHGARSLPYRGGRRAGNKALCRMRKGFYPRGAASLLLRSLQGRGQPPQEPGTHEEKTAEKQGSPLRLGPVNPLYFQGFAGLFHGASYLSVSGPCFAG